MKRYSVSVAYGRNEDNKVYFHYHDRTDSPEEVIEKYRKNFIRWSQSVQNINDELRDIVNDYIGVRIVDTQTKKVVFEESHISEELGWKRECEEVKTEWGIYRKGHWVKI